MAGSPAQKSGSLAVTPASSTAYAVAAGTRTLASVTVNVNPHGIQVPDVRYFGLEDATTKLAQAGFGYVLGGQTIDPMCNNVGNVVMQNPAAKSLLEPGSAVTLSLGMRDPNRACPARRKFLLFSVGWEAGGGMQASTVDPLGPIYRFINGINNEWFNVASYGKHPGFEIRNGGEYLISTPPAPPSGRCDDPFRSHIVDNAKAAAEARGVDTGHVDGYLYHWARGCIDTGGYISGNSIFLSANAAQNAAVMHEFGHFLGLAHSNLLKCTVGGQLVPFGDTCVATADGDPFDTMGVAFHGAVFSSPLLSQLGWLDSLRAETVVAADATTIALLKPLADPSEGLHSVLLLDGGNTFWIEYRRPVGIDARGYADPDIPEGVVIHREALPTAAVPYRSQLLDMQPGNPGKYVMSPGQTWSNPLGTMNVTFESTGPLGASVIISSNLRTVPDVQGATISMAADRIRASGLSYAGFTGTRDLSCNYLGLAMGTNPAAGQRLAVGTPVTVTVGESDPNYVCP